MKTDIEIKVEAMDILIKTLGNVEAERFVALVQRDKFDYTSWRKNLPEEETIEELSRKAMEYRNKIG